MSQRMFHQVALCGALAFATSTASAQFFPGSSVDPCAPAQTVAVAQQCVMTCQPAPLVPVAQTCYQSVPVTEYQQVQRTVERPVVETRYVDQEVTAYRPITETRVAEVPITQYQNVTEYQTVTRDMGQWVTQRECIYRPSPCQYDPRPGLLGGLNRWGYSMRTAFSPSFRTRRDYVPNYVAQTVPVTRQVAIPGTRQVTYNVTRMEAYQTTRKVAVNSVRMVAEQVTEMQPVTVMRTVPTGTRVAYVSPSSLATASRTALAPNPDPLASQRASVATGQPTTVRPRTADASETKAFQRSSTSQPYDANKATPEAFKRNGETFKEDPSPFPPTTGQIQQQNFIPSTTQVGPVTRHDELWEAPVLPQLPNTPAEPAKLQPPASAQPLTARPANLEPPVRPSRSIPSVARVSQWSGRTATNGLPQNPAFAAPGVSVAVD